MPEKTTSSSGNNPSQHAIDFRTQPIQITTNLAPASLWQKVVAFLVVLIIAVSAIAVILLSQRLIDAQTKFATEQAEIVHQIITKIDDLQALNEKQLQTLKSSQAKELRTFKELQEQKLQELQNAQTSLLETFKENRNEQLKLLREQMKNLPGAPKHDD